MQVQFFKKVQGKKLSIWDLGKRLVVPHIQTRYEHPVSEAR